MLTSFIVLFFMFGFDYYILLFSIIPYSAMSVFWIYLNISKNKHIKFDEESILYKKKRVLFDDIHNITISKYPIFNIIEINGLFRKNHLRFQDIRNPRFNDFKNHIIRKCVSAKVKSKNRNYFYSFFIGSLLILSVFPLVVKPHLQQINFITDQSVLQNAYTDHYSFRVNNIRFQSTLNDSVKYILSDNVRISYVELPYIPAKPIKSIEEYYDLKSDNAIIEFWSIPETRPFKSWAKRFLIMKTNPKILTSDTLKGALIAYPHDHKLTIRHKSSNSFLLMNFHGKIKVNEILEVVKSIDYKE